MRRHRRGLSFGSMLMLLLTAAAVFGTYYFLSNVANDSPAAAMNIPEIVSAVEDALKPHPTAVAEVAMTPVP